MTTCRAPSSQAEHDLTSATRETNPGSTSAKVQPHPVADEPGEPKTRADERTPGAAAPSEPAPAAPTEPAPSEPEPSEAEPTSAPPTTEPEPTSAPPPSEPARSKKPCRRPGPRANGPLRDLVGLDEAAVRRCLGPPDRTSGSTWHYRWPKGCAYEVTRVVVRFARGTVARADAEHEITGQHCGSDF